MTRQDNKKSPAKPRQYYKNPLVPFSTAEVSKGVQESLDKGKDALAQNPFMRARSPMKVELAPLPEANETPDEVEERANPMNPFIRAGIEAVGGSLGGWLVSYLAASVNTSIANSPQPSPTMTKVIFYGAGVAPSLVFSIFSGKAPVTWQGALAGAALYPVIEDVLGRVQGVTP